jgi:hypothetical protein
VESILQALAIWMTLVAMIAMISIALLLPSTWRRLAVVPARPPVQTPVAEPAGTHTGELRLVDGPAVPDDVTRFAAEVAVAAQRAAATAARRRGEWEIASDAVDDAWAAYEEADRAARRLDAAAAYPMITKSRPRTENADRRRYLHHAATAACRRHEISIAQLNEILAHRGWNPRLHPVVQEAALGHAIRTYRFEAWQQACARERAAWRTADAAADALRHLRAEARAAQVAKPVPTSEEAWWTEQWDSTVPIRSTVDSRHPIAA